MIAVGTVRGATDGQNGKTILCQECRVVGARGVVISNSIRDRRDTHSPSIGPRASVHDSLRVLSAGIRKSARARQVSCGGVLGQVGLGARRSTPSIHGLSAPG